jgi:hypothetical protein
MQSNFLGGIVVWACILGGLFIGIIVPVIALIHVWIGNLSVERKLLWAIMLVIFGVFAAIAYYFSEIRAKPKV